MFLNEHLFVLIMKITKLGIGGNGLVGLYILPLDNIVLVGPEIPESLYEELERIFGAPILSTTVAGTGLLGVFCATNGEVLAVPSIIFSHEEDALKKAGVVYHKIPGSLTCLGNNIVVTKKGMLVNPSYEQEALDALANAFDVPVKTYMLEDAPTIGSFVAHNSSSALVSHDFTEEQIKELENFLGLSITTGTINMGSTQVRSGIAVNNNGMIIGELSGGPEVVNADEAFSNTELK